jgi:C4-dicarboxylate-specific signal transduction histidine kinase
LSKYQEIVDVATGRSQPDNSNLLTILNTARGALNLAFVYVMDHTGKVVGCSTALEGKSLTGERYPFRPYFQQALGGRRSFYPAVGITTKKKGFYFSAPILTANSDVPVGVVVIKTRSETIDTFFSGPRDQAEALLVSRNGVVFASTAKDWILKTAWLMPKASLTIFNNPDSLVTNYLDRYRFRCNNPSSLPADNDIQSMSRPWPMKIGTLLPERRSLSLGDYPAAQRCCSLPMGD